MIAFFFALDQPRCQLGDTCGGRMLQRLRRRRYRSWISHRAVHFDVEHGNVVSRHVGQVELDNALNLGLLATLDIAADGLGVPFHRLARYFQACQQLHLLASLIKRRVAAYHGYMRLTPGE